MLLLLTPAPLCSRDGLRRCCRGTSGLGLETRACMALSWKSKDCFISSSCAIGTHDRYHIRDILLIPQTWYPASATKFETKGWWYAPAEELRVKLCRGCATWCEDREFTGSNARCAMCQPMWRDSKRTRYRRHSQRQKSQAPDNEPASSCENPTRVTARYSKRKRPSVLWRDVQMLRKLYIKL